jgi:hypothetical protein
MSIDVEKLYTLLPAIYRLRDADQGEPLKALLSVIAEQVGVIEEDLAQMYDDEFIETCADWVVPYIGDLIGYRTLNDASPQVSNPRAEVANTISYRRRKGTASMLEQLARDVTGWDVRVVEFFLLLATTQYMNHLRPNNFYAPDLRQWEPLERLNSAFDSIAHTADVRRISSGRGRFNIPNIGIFLFRLKGYSLTESPAVGIDNFRFLFSPLGNNTPLFNRSQSDPQAEVTRLSTPFEVSMPISRRVLDKYLDEYYGSGKSILLQVGGAPVDVSKVVVCNLSDIASNKWAHEPDSGKIAIDPVLGRIAFSTKDVAPQQVVVTFHYGFSKDMGGGEYERVVSFVESSAPVRVKTPNKIQDAIDNLGTQNVIEIDDSGRYEETLTINAPPDKHIELRAANMSRPTIVLQSDFQISGGANAEVTLNGLLISGHSIQVVGSLARVRFRHCTLVPGLTLDVNGVPSAPTQLGLVVSSPNTIVEIDDCIVGGVRATDDAQVIISNSIVDAIEETNVAFAAPDGNSAGGSMQIKNSTVIGKVHTSELILASNTIFMAALPQSDTWDAPVWSERRQEGCVRYSYVPPKSRVPRRFHCQPESDANNLRVRPQFTSRRYGDPGYGQLSHRCAIEIRHGADDESEMGAFHDLYQPQRETNLRVRLDEYLRFGLEAGIIYAT